MYNADGLGRSPPIPNGATPLAHQVAGHVFGEGKTKLGFLQLNDGTLVKPIHGCISEEDQILRRQGELVFYQKVFSLDCRDPALTSLRPLIPTFYGTWNTEEHPGITYLHLEDITRRFSRPCILDIKIGRITYAPDADPEKVEREKAKYPPAADIGFQLIGMRVYEKDKEEYLCRDRHFLRSLSIDELYNSALRDYCQLDSNPAPHPAVAKGILSQLKNIEDWFMHQSSYSFIASSLLLVYEGDVSRQSKESAQQLTDIRMIDFPRVYPAKERDENYLIGLRNLICYFEMIVEHFQKCGNFTDFKY